MTAAVTLAQRSVGYTAAMRTMHWASASLLIGSYASAWAISSATSSDGVSRLMLLHRSFGLAILTLTAIRFCWRQRAALPELPPDVPPLQRLAAKGNVIGLYMLLVAQPLLGLTASMLHGDRIVLLGGLVLPGILPIDRKLAHVVFAVHGTVALMLLSLIGLHGRRSALPPFRPPGRCARRNDTRTAARRSDATNRRDAPVKSSAMKWQPLARREQTAAAHEAVGFEDVVLPHLAAAYNVARWLVRDPTLAEDVVQDATVRALRYFTSYHGGNARAWLLQIVRNVAYEARAARQRHAATSLNEGPQDEGAVAAMEVVDPSDDPEAALSRREDHMKLQHALDGLPVDLRECLVLRELEELSYKEIAQVTGVPVGTVMSRLWRARQALVPVRAYGGSR